MSALPHQLLSVLEAAIGWDPVLQALAVTGFALVCPVLLAPIMISAYLAGFLFRDLWGIPVAFIAYGIATVFYYFAGRMFGALAIIERSVQRVTAKMPAGLQHLRFFHVLVASLLLPFLPLALYLGVTRQDRSMVVTGMMVGAIPSILLAFQAGVAGQAFVRGHDTRQLVISLLFLLGALATGFLIKAGAKRFHD